MPSTPKAAPVYVLGTGLSHNGSACLLRDGEVAVAIEKERLTRRKHDGGNDALAVQYCLDALGIRFTDLSLVVQAANFEKDIRADYYCGRRLHHPDVPVTTISHHLAHAYSAVATSPFREGNVLVIDGAGSPAAQCDDWPDADTKTYWLAQSGFYCEKDSFYHYDGGSLTCLQKDFSESRLYAPASGALRMPTTYHSIGGLYAAASDYCFGNLDDAGKLMGLAPYGTNTYLGEPLFELKDERVWVRHEALSGLTRPAADYEAFRQNFQHYADVARWVQKETERAVTYIARCRTGRFPHANLCYAGGVALNAVCNAALLSGGVATNLYIQPAAGDNGLSIGCAYYGWHHIHRKEIPHRRQSPSVFFGAPYSNEVVLSTLQNHPETNRFRWHRSENAAAETAAALAGGKTVAWYQDGCEFGPRALGHRSILADPRLPGIQQHINGAIKLREDFRPFAPAVLKEDVRRYFRHGWDSPYMILVDEIREDWRGQLPGIVHVDGTCRVQTVDESWNPQFHALLRHFKAHTGIGVLINTSLNCRGMPIVETPREAVDFFLSSALDVLVLHSYILTKPAPL